MIKLNLSTLPPTPSPKHQGGGERCLTLCNGGITLVMLLLFLFSLPTHAQDDDDDLYNVTVVPESAVIRALPSQEEGEFVASAFRSDVLEAVGINLDGTWFLVRRPGRMSNLGWISRTVIDYEFMPETLPLLDFETGETGNFDLTRDTGFSAFTLAEVNLREQPLSGTRVITRAPFGVVLPILERDQIGDWFLVSYLGTTGWVNSVNLRGIDDFEDVPIASGLPEIEVASTFVIPLSVQLEEIAEFRGYLNGQYAFATELANFWNEVLDFEVMPCEPPQFVTNYLFTQSDERAFPELEYLVPRLDTATEFINDAIEPLYDCGVIDTPSVIEAKNNASNAAIIYSSTLSSIDSIEATITANR